MTMLEAFVKERNEALFSLDREKIEAWSTKKFFVFFQIRCRFLRLDVAVRG